MKIQELDEARWKALVRLSDAVQAHRASTKAGLPVECQLDALDELEGAYVSAHGRHRALLESGFEEESSAA